MYPEVASVRAGWCESMYGAASAVMREVYDRLEAQWCRCVDAAARARVDKQLPVLMNRPEQLNAVDPPDTGGDVWRIEQFAERIDAALGLADGVARTRVQYFRQAFEVTRALALASRPVRVTQAALASAGASARLTAAQFNAPGFAGGRAALEALNRQVVGIDPYRQNVRDPVHQALARAGVAQLGAPASGVSWMRELIAAPPTAVFSYADVMFERASLAKIFRVVATGRPRSKRHGRRGGPWVQGDPLPIEGGGDGHREGAGGRGDPLDGTALNADGPFDGVRFHMLMLVEGCLLVRHRRASAMSRRHSVGALLVAASQVACVELVDGSRPRDAGTDLRMIALDVGSDVRRTDHEPDAGWTDQGVLRPDLVGHDAPPVDWTRRHVDLVPDFALDLDWADP